MSTDDRCSIRDSRNNYFCSCTNGQLNNFRLDSTIKNPLSTDAVSATSAQLQRLPASVNSLSLIWLLHLRLGKLLLLHCLRWKHSF